MKYIFSDGMTIKRRIINVISGSGNRDISALIINKKLLMQYWINFYYASLIFPDSNPPFFLTLTCASSSTTLSWIFKRSPLAFLVLLVSSVSLSYASSIEKSFIWLIFRIITSIFSNYKVSDKNGKIELYLIDFIPCSLTQIIAITYRLWRIKPLWLINRLFSRFQQILIWL